MNEIDVSAAQFRASGITSGGKPVTLDQLGSQQRQPDAGPQAEARRKRVAEYAALRRSGVGKNAAARRVGIAYRTATQYETEAGL